MEPEQTITEAAQSIENISTPAPASLPLLGSAESVAATVLVALILSYFLIFRTSRKAAGSTRPEEPEEYFQAILGETSLDSWSGAEQGCKWSQTNDEVEVIVPMPEGARGKDVSCRVLATSLKISVQGSVVVEVRYSCRVSLRLSRYSRARTWLSVLCVPFARRAQGKLFRRVEHEEGDWSIEDSEGARILKLTLVKSVPTKGTQHWTSLMLDAKGPTGPEI